MHSTFSVCHSRLLLVAAITIALGACAQHETRAPKASVSTTSTAPKPAHATKAKPTPATPSPAPKAAATTSGPMTAPDQNQLNAPTGIAECDDYLGNYKACHMVLATPFTDIDAQLTKVRTNILDTARDKGMEAARAKCIALVQQRDETLNGRSCK